MLLFLLQYTPKSPKGDFLHQSSFQIVADQKPLQGFGVKHDNKSFSLLIYQITDCIVTARGPRLQRGAIGLPIASALYFCFNCFHFSGCKPWTASPSLQTRGRREEMLHVCPYHKTLKSHGTDYYKQVQSQQNKGGNAKELKQRF